MLRVNQVKLKIGHSPEQLRKKTAEILRVPMRDILSVHIVRQSIDARKKPEIFYSYSVDVEVENESRVLHKFQGKENLVSRSDSDLFFSGIRNIQAEISHSHSRHGTGRLVLRLFSGAAWL